MIEHSRGQEEDGSQDYQASSIIISIPLESIKNKYSMGEFKERKAPYLEQMKESSGERLDEGADFGA